MQSALKRVLNALQGAADPASSAPPSGNEFASAFQDVHGLASDDNRVKEAKVCLQSMLSHWSSAGARGVDSNECAQEVAHTYWTRNVLWFVPHHIDTHCITRSQRDAFDVMYVDERTRFQKRIVVCVDAGDLTTSFALRALWRASNAELRHGVWLWKYMPHRIDKIYIVKSRHMKGWNAICSTLLTMLSAKLRERIVHVSSRSDVDVQSETTVLHDAIRVAHDMPCKVMTGQLSGDEGDTKHDDENATVLAFRGE